MMWSSVVSAALLMQGPVPAQVRVPLELVHGSLIRIEAAGQTRGVGVLVDGRGLVISTLGISSLSSPTGVLHDGTRVNLRVRSVDEVSQLIMLGIQDWDKVQGNVKGWRVATLANPATSATRVFMVTQRSTAMGELSATGRPGILRNSERFVPLTEIRFESTRDSFTGAAVFTLEGNLVGIVNATLAPLPTTPRGTGATSFQNEYRPGPLVVGYALDQRVLNRVVTGFRGPDQTVKHPTFGLFYRNTSRGVVVDRVDAGSPAHRAGLKANDRLITLDEKPVRDSFWLAAELFSSDVDVARVFKIGRGQQELLVAVTPVAMRRPQEGRQPHLGKPQILHEPLDALHAAERIQR